MTGGRPQEELTDEVKRNHDWAVRVRDQAAAYYADCLVDGDLAEAGQWSAIARAADVAVDGLRLLGKVWEGLLAGAQDEA